MIRPPKSDFWKVGVVPASIESWAESTSAPGEVTWLPNPGPWRYLADPFGVQRDGLTHVFVEAFDYRTKHAVIEHHELDAELGWLGKSVALERPFHLSYPYIVEDRGEVFMIPESHRAGEIALYRSRQFPGDWVRETVLLMGVPGAEPSLIRYQDQWWMFFTIVGPDARDQRELHVAFAPRLTGPWQLHQQNPVLNDRSGARPGGTPYIGADGAVVLPVQDCSETYGGALRFVRFKSLTRARIETEHLGPTLRGECVSSTHHDGFHTLSSCGALTLIDTKRVTRSWGRVGLDWRRRVRASVAQLGK
jgi:hypothetical protein